MPKGFKRALGFGLAWVGATALAMIVAAAAVGSLRSQVTDTPTVLGSTQTVALVASDTVPDADGGVIDESTVEPSTSTLAPGSDDDPGPDIILTTTTSPASTTTTGPPATTTTTGPPATTTTTAPPTTTTTAAPAEAYTKTYDTPGGSVRIRVEGDSVTFAGAVPLPGWSVELKDDGPERVEVEFDENDGEGEVEFSARVEDGELDVDISVE